LNRKETPNPVFLSAFSFQLSAFNFQLSTFNFQLFFRLPPPSTIQNTNTNTTMNPIQSKSLPALAAALAAVVLTTIPARGAPWTPAELSQPSALWLDASDSGTITLSGSAVSQWNDKSGNSRNFAQATGGNQPAYSATSFNTSYPGVTFDGSSDFMSAGDTLDVGSQSLGIIAAVKYNTSNTSGMVISKTRYAAGAGRYFMGRFQGTGFGLGSGTQYQYVAESDFASAISPSADSSTSPRLLGLDLNRQTSGSIKNWIDGVAVKTSTFTGNATAYNSNDLLLLGAYGNPTGTGPQASSYLSGVISEVVVVQTAMSDTDRQKLEGYLAWKWGMQANLPEGHSYKSAAPESNDTTPPTIATLNPTDDASGVLTYANLATTFNEGIQKGTGNITLKKSADNSEVETFDVATSPRITVSGATLTIDPTGYLEGNTGYYVEIDATAVKDLANNAFAGIANTTTWNFTTGVADTTAPTIATLSPADNATGVDLEANLVATFDETIQKGTGTITLKKSADNSTVETFNVATSPRITVSGASLTIDPTGTLVLATGYYVQIAPAAIQDLSGNSFAGIADSTTWNFTTRAIVLYDDFAVNPNLSSGLWTHSQHWNGLCGTPAWNSGTEDLTLGLPTTALSWSQLRRTEATRGATDPVTLQIKSLSKSGASWGVVGLSISAQATPTLESTSPRYLFFLLTDNGTDWKYQLKRDANNVVWTSSTFTLASLVFPIRLDAVRNGDNYDFKVNGSTVVTGSSYTSAQHDSLVYYHMTWSIGTPSAMTATVDNFGISAATPTPYDTWANGTYSPALTAKLPTDNQDGDSLNNLQEYAFGTQPTVSTGEIVYSGGTLTTPGAPKVVAAAGTYSMVFGRRADYVAAGLTYTVQFSAGLDAWVDNNDGTNAPVQVATDGTINAMSVPFVDFIDTPSGTQKPTFARVKVVQAP
jgi:methionine-rich copper-binding protein CopC